MIYSNVKLIFCLCFGVASFIIRFLLYYITLFYVILYNIVSYSLNALLFFHRDNLRFQNKDAIDNHRDEISFSSPVYRL